MKAFKFLHFSDLHLDMPFGSMGRRHEKKEQRKQDILDVFDKIISIAEEMKVDAILIGGDLYEHQYVRKSTIDYINLRFSKIPNIKVFIVPGNHDPYIQNSYYKNYIWSNNVIILSVDNPYAVLEDLMVCVHGIGFNSFYEEKAILTSLRQVDKEYINILLMHGTVDMNFTMNKYNPVSSDELAVLDMDYIAAGHFHSRIDDLGGKKVIYNPGSPEPLGFDEEGEHGVYLCKAEWNNEFDKSLEISFIRTGKRAYSTLEVGVDGLYDDRQTIEKIIDETSNMDRENLLLHVILRGYVEPGYSINKDRIEKEISNMFFMLKIDDETLSAYNYYEMAMQPGLKGLFTAKMLSKISNAQSEKEIYLLKKALQYGIEALEDRL